jgi:hypothetical protein
MKIFGIKLTIGKILSFIVTGILLGFLAALGEDFYNWLKTSDYQNLYSFFKLIINFFSKTIEIKLFTIILIFVLAIPIYKLLVKKIVVRLFSERIFHEDFSTNSNFWVMNYWGSSNPHKTNRIENNSMIFEAQPNEWPKDGIGGAYYDLMTGLEEGLTYEVSCKVKSSPGTTMKFQLWLHDTMDRNSVITVIEIPPENVLKTYILKFKSTDSKAIRIHLHCFSGAGQIIVNEVSVLRKRISFFPF